MFNVFFRPYVPGFSVKTDNDVPGFDIDEYGLPRRARPSFDRGISWSPLTLTIPQDLSPVRAGSSLSRGFELAATDRGTAWAICHPRCVVESVGRGYGPDAPLVYRRCMRECMAEHGHFDY